jgi:HEAT repeat protein
MAGGEQDTGVLEAIAHGFGHLGEPYGLDTLLRLAAHEDARVREASAIALAGRGASQAVDALIRLSRDEESDVRDWATFALGMLSAHDTQELREALAERLGDADPETRLEAVHGLAVRGDTRAVEPALELLAAAARSEGDGMWRRLELRETAQRLAAQTGDERFEQYLPGSEA